MTRSGHICVLLSLYNIYIFSKDPPANQRIDRSGVEWGTEEIKMMGPDDGMGGRRTGPSPSVLRTWKLLQARRAGSTPTRTQQQPTHARFCLASHNHESPVLVSGAYGLFVCNLYTFLFCFPYSSNKNPAKAFCRLSKKMSRPGQGVPSVLVRFGFGCLDY